MNLCAYVVHLIPISSPKTSQN